jgi:DNA replication and repair protein RecF
VRITRLRIDGLRNLRAVDIEPSPLFNLILGDNGAGKTSVIEAMHLMAHGRSFRSGQIDSLARHGSKSFTAAVRIRDGMGRERDLGISRDDGEWVLRENGATVPTLVEFVRFCAVITLEPETHSLITGPSEVRRRFLDWVLFHVEPGFLGSWRRYLRALRQRNASLRAHRYDPKMVEAWEPDLALAGSEIDASRRRLLESIADILTPMLARLLPGVSISGIRYRSGWPATLSLAEALVEGRAADRERGFTQRGPHRSDWRLDYAGLGQQNQLSRGQAKLTAIACLLSQASYFKSLTQEWPIFACDDLASELDRAHQAVVLEWLAASGAQVFISGTERGASWSIPASTSMFHVEQGQVTPLL